jgi:protein deglycase
MKKVAVLIDNGFEEIELLLTVDIMRRAEIDCRIISIKDNEVNGKHHITIQSDLRFENTDFFEYDMIIIPSGFNNKESISTILNDYIKHKKWIGLMGNAISLINTKPLLDNELFSLSDNILLNKGYSTTYAFIYQCLELLGIDSEPIKQRMVYYNAFNEKKVN